MEALFEIDAARAIADWNAEAEQMFGWTPVEAVGMPSNRLVPPRNRDAYDRGLVQLAATARTDKREITAVHRDGREFKIEITLASQNRDGHQSFVAFAREMSPRQRALDAVGWDADRFRAILDQIEDGCFVVDLRGHYLFVNDAFCRIFGVERTDVLGAHFSITTTNRARRTETLALYADVFRTGRAVKSYEYAVELKSQADGLLPIVNCVPDFPKIGSRKIELESAPFTLSEVVDDVVKPLEIAAREKGLDITSRIAATVPARTVGDAVRLKQVLTNLIANAIKFTERGMVTLDVLVDAEDAGATTLHFMVTDTGIGIPAGKLVAIFQPFRQADGSTTRRFGGTGLGLTISATLVQLMGGRIWVHSEPGAGSTFHFTAPFPIAPARDEGDRRHEPRPGVVPAAGTARVPGAEGNLIH